MDANDIQANVNPVSHFKLHGTLTQLACIKGCSLTVKRKRLELETCKLLSNGKGSIPTCCQCSRYLVPNIVFYNDFRTSSELPSETYNLVIIVGSSLSADVHGARNLIRSWIKADVSVVWLNPQPPSQEIRTILGPNLLVLQTTADDIFSNRLVKEIVWPVL